MSLIINKRLFESHAPGFSYEKTALQKCLVETNVFDNRIINMRSIRYLSTRKFHTNLLLSRSINADDRIRTTDTKKSNLKIDIKGLVEKQPNIKNYFENNEENNTDNVETNVKDHNVHESLHHSKREKFSIKGIVFIYL